jgi:glutaredoxin 3
MNNTSRLYTIDGCHRCIKVKQYLESKNITYDEINIIHHSERVKELLDRAGEVVTPTLITKEKILIGEKQIYSNLRTDL